MKLKEGEEIIKIYHHHYTTLIFRELVVALLSIPFFLVGAFFNGVLSPWQMFLLYGAIALIFILVMLYDGILFHMDRLVITNMRIVYIDWQNAFSRSEHQAELSEIQDIETKETGVLSFLPIFDYGTFILETAAAHTIIKFNDAPDPEGIKHFIYHLLRKPNRIRTASSALSDDKARQTVDEAAAVARRQ
jgi:hypothetical protein